MRTIITCEVCGNPHIKQVMDLGPLTLPDDLVKIGDPRQCTKYPTEVMYCHSCRTAQMRHRPPNTVVFPPEYHYRAANTKDVLSGMQGLVDSVEKDRLVKGLQVLDIGCNDGSLLDAFRGRGAITRGIEPTNAAQEAASKGHGIEQVYFDATQAARYVDFYGPPDIVTFVNVFAHIDGLPSLLSALRILCGPNTLLVIENHYLGSVLERGQFDTFYHEHPRTYSYSSFVQIAHLLGRNVAHVEFPVRYGGNIRVFLKHGATRPNHDILERERGFGVGLEELDRKVAVWKHKKRYDLTSENNVWSAAAFPGRAAILFQLLGFDAKEIDAVYEVPRSKKIGYYAPGTRIPIKSDLDFFTNPDSHPGPVVNMAWHIPAEIERRWRSNGYTGRIVPIIQPSDFT